MLQENEIIIYKLGKCKMKLFSHPSEILMILKGIEEYFIVVQQN